MFNKQSKHGDYGIFVGGSYCSSDFEIVTGNGSYDSVGFVVVHDDTEHGLSEQERNDIALASIHQNIFWNDIECYHWMYDFQCDGHWCEMWRGNDEEPYYLVQHMIVTD